MVGQDLQFAHPLASVDDNEVKLSAGVHHPQIGGESALPESFQSAPVDPWNVNLGLQCKQPLSEGWTATSGVNIDSASDRPRTTLREMNVGLNAALRIPHDDHNSWLVTLNYVPRGEAALPMPSVAFNYDPSPQFHASVGFPFQCSYKPSDAWEFQASYMLVHTIHAKAIYKFTDRFNTFAAYDWASEAIMLLDTLEPNARIFINDPRVSAGVQTTLPWHWTASTSAGYVFDRYLFDGASLAPSGGTASNLGNGAFASVNVDLRY